MKRTIFHSEADEMVFDILLLHKYICWIVRGCAYEVIYGCCGKMSGYRALYRLCTGFPRRPLTGESLEELNRNLKEVIELLLEDGEPKLEAEFVGTQNVVVA